MVKKTVTSNTLYTNLALWKFAEATALLFGTDWPIRYKIDFISNKAGYAKKISIQTDYMTKLST